MKLTVIAIALLAAANATSAQEHAAHTGAQQPTTGTVPTTTSAVSKDQSTPGMDMSNTQEAATNKSMDGMKMPPSAQGSAVPTSKNDAAPMQHDATHQMSSPQMTPEQMKSMPGMKMAPQSGAMPGMKMDAPAGSMARMKMGESMGDMPGMFGRYPMTREASGTSWQPESTPMEGIQTMNGPWMTMYHGYINAVYDHQGGPRGDKQAFAESMFMAMASRPLGNGTLGLRAMVSLDPTIGKSGYPLLFETGETANGRTPLIDRQHPHDLLMELSASYSYNLGPGSSVFAYVGLPGEPALGPPAFMHRMSGMDNPEAPLTHHWLDSTHITFGVVTAGYIWRTFKVEASSFNGREPDQYRWNVETRKFDSASARLSWNPTPEWSLQVSHGRLDSPELLEPDVAVRRTTASASYEHAIAGHPMQTTLAWGRNRHDPGITTNGYLLESAMHVRDDWTVFGRFEKVENNELFQEGEPQHGQVFNVRKLSLGFVHDFAQLGKVKLGAGALVSKFGKPTALDSVYGSSPTSYMLFFRAKLAM